ncbi:hypothetical protein BO70DRAFT_394595 [Aspergillus heteromorphus CBS 117.55]|uniref:Uncharacterized protein n=1 Tax=Aspergillus heteromorphus CBS 117.55 TaxID=1448321 RepID=A0A317WS33_9EURO|nr:uncharacterized protein BO70DRAFT_394595 [Aspergillus heteromorphus CBS 117.55]PWY87728.1 hypothetical protein BO70DRAFT_394595 [Aspergillus heteromorphus CBS 117.55]
MAGCASTLHFATTSDYRSQVARQTGARAACRIDLREPGIIGPVRVSSLDPSRPTVEDEVAFARWPSFAIGRPLSGLMSWETCRACDSPRVENGFRRDPRCILSGISIQLAREIGTEQGLALFSNAVLKQALSRQGPYSVLGLSASSGYPQLIVIEMHVWWRWSKICCDGGGSSQSRTVMRVMSLSLLPHLHGN